MSGHFLLILLTSCGKERKMQGLPSILSLIPDVFEKLGNTRAQMLDFIYHMTLRFL